ncbi:permease [Candidatus Poribacteria bacterium]|nr:permease [Candidatus Poribacteria bacterium]
MKERTKLALIVGAFLIAYFLPVTNPRFQSAVIESFYMTKEYAQKHVLFCLVPAFFIAGAIACFVSQASVMKYFGPAANKVLAYGVASVSGTILAVCSCTVLPLFAGIHRRGAGLGPAIAFLYSGPAINVLAIILTARVLGWELGLARAVGAVVFSVVIGLIMATIYHKEESEKKANADLAVATEGGRSLGQSVLYFLTMVLILVFAAWGKPTQPVGFWDAVYRIHWPLTIFCLLILAFVIWRWFLKDELQEWVDSTWGFAKQILPLLLGGVLAAGLLTGRPEFDNGLIPAKYIAAAVGGNSVWANLLASVAGAFMYFATLTEVPIIQGLIGNGMGQGPALALLLAGPALSLPSMVVLRSVMGTQKTVVYCSLVVIMATITGMIYGLIVG